MKKLIYSTLGLILAGSLILAGCKDDGGDDGGGGGGGGTVTPKPIITFLNTAGYNFASASVLNNATLKFGMVVTSTIDLKSVKVTKNFNGTGEVIVLDSTLASKPLTFSKDIIVVLDGLNKGNYVFTFSALDKDLTLGTSTITITATGPLVEISGQKVYNNKGSGLGAYDLVQGIPITSTGTDKTVMDILDMSTTSSIQKEWSVGAGCTSMFIKGPFDKQYSQLKSEADVKDLWDRYANGATNKISNMTGLGLMVLVKVVRTGKPLYYVMTIDDIVDDVGADNDYTTFTYKY